MFFRSTCVRTVPRAVKPAEHIQIISPLKQNLFYFKLRLVLIQKKDYTKLHCNSSNYKLDKHFQEYIDVSCSYWRTAKYIIELYWEWVYHRNEISWQGIPKYTFLYPWIKKLKTGRFRKCKSEIILETILDTFTSDWRDCAIQYYTNLF